ncbi:MAG: flagellar motor switch protein FliN/FliY [Gammaproteobacteria bacterium]|nr:MAG: flagellar motor switch protein FliN/FliY [Gammaproteobacteria bacterium]TND06735.1 MAG: flagellar motor switch protein FliN/FliY [Gammaproteobacteria bacterium]
MSDNADEETRNEAADAATEVTEAEAEETVDETSEPPKKTYQKAEFQNLSAASGAPLGDKNNLDLILDVPVVISMELGRTSIPIRNLMQLTQGSVVELNRLAGEPMDVLVNGTLIAHGEVVVVNEKFGIRLTDVVSPVERVKKLG